MLELQLFHGTDYTGDNGDELDLPKCCELFHTVMNKLRDHANAYARGDYGKPVRYDLKSVNVL